VKDLSPLARARAMANTLAPQYWGLNSIQAALGHVDQAWQQLGEAESVLDEYFRLECAQRELDVLPDATLLDLARAVAETDHAGLESMIVKVREHLYYRAVLYRLSRDLDSAEDSLESASLIPDYPFADESRLAFNEPMERLRIAIARGDFASASAINAASALSTRMGQTIPLGSAGRRGRFSKCPVSGDDGTSRNEARTGRGSSRRS
jgi:hypothetical protein